MRVLVTGASGFVGGHALADLNRAGHHVIGMVAPGQSTALHHTVACEALDLGDADGITDLVRRHKPDACLHLAGMAFVPAAWEQPQEAFRVNVIGAINLLEAFRLHAQHARFLTITSAQLYGHAAREKPIAEDDFPVPDSIYAVSKWSADCSTLLYHQRYGLHTMTARPCNHIGPGQSESFVVSSFARQLIEIERGTRPNTIKVGNLASQREFTDVRDTARAYRLLLENGQPGQAYNVASGRFVTIQSLFDQLCDIVGVKPTVEIDPELFRPTDQQPLIDTAKIKAHTGWQPEIPMRQTLMDVVAYFRGRLA